MLELLGELARVQRPRSAERDEREVSRIVAALDRHDPQRAQHLRVYRCDDGRGVDVAERSLRRLAIQPRPPASRSGSLPSRRLASVTVGRVPPLP